MVYIIYWILFTILPHFDILLLLLFYFVLFVCVVKPHSQCFLHIRLCVCKCRACMHECIHIFKCRFRVELGLILCMSAYFVPVLTAKRIHSKSRKKKHKRNRAKIKKRRRKKLASFLKIKYAFRFFLYHFIIM